MALKKGISFLLLFVFLLHASWCQQTTILRIFESNEQVQKIQFTDTNKLNAHLLDYYSNLKLKGFAAASIDSIIRDSITVNAYVFKGKQYELGAVELNLDSDIVKKLNLKKKINQYPHFNFEKLEKLQTSVLSHFENNGFPFAKVFYDDWSIENDSFSMRLNVEKGNLILLDSFNNTIKSKVSSQLIKSFLGISKNDLYNESLVQKIDERLAKLPYIKVVKPSQVEFREDKADIKVAVERKKTNQIDFIFGVLPKNSITGKIAITGEARVNLWNAFGRGEKVFIEWRKLERSSQNLQILFEYPFLLGTPIGVHTDFGLKKRDTTHLDINWSLGVPYQFSDKGSIQMYFRNFQTIVLKPDTLFASRNKKLPALQDVSSFVYGGELYLNDLDNFFNPQSGWEIRTSLGFGTRKIKKVAAYSEIQSIAFPDYNFNNLYDSIDLKSLKTELAWQLNYYWKFAPRHVLKLGSQGKGIFNKNILENEFFRIGGAKVLRGFDDESIRPSLYAMINFEYRFLLSSNSYFLLFYDGAFTQQKSSIIKNDFPFGFGAGINFATKIGIFGLTYAIGREQQNPIDLRSAKIHFGYLNYF